MSFTANSKGVGYEPGYFLAHEECTRETREFAQDSALVATTDYGAKYVPMGTAYPTNDGNAIGITYEDVDVTNGNVPGSVVTKGEVYENRLAITDVSYNAVSPVGTENPSEEGWYEKNTSNEYVLTTDTEVDDQKTYYAQTVTRLASAAKSALAALGFTFKTEATVTRPNFGKGVV